MIINSCESLKYFQLSQDIKIVSLDIFDTLLIRRIEPPEKAKRLSCQKAVKERILNCTSTELLVLREKIEGKLKNQSQAEGKDREFSLCDVFTEIVSDLQQTHTKKIAAKLLDIELEVEKTVLAPMPGIEDILDSLSQKIPLIATSDTYLTKAMLFEILQHFRLGKYFKRIYASSFYKLSKSTGNLFKYILETENIKTYELQHIGDNFISDYFIPKKMGIKAVYLNDKWNFSRKQNLQLMNKLETKSSFWTNYAQLNRLFPVQKTSHSKNDLLYNLGYSFTGPLLTVFIHLLFLEVTRKGINNIFFIARDGFLLKRIFNLFANTLISDRCNVNTHYLCISRYTAVMASIKQLGEREWKNTIRLAAIVKDVLTRLGVTIEEANSLLNRYHLSPESRITENNTLKSLRELFNNESFSELVQIKSHHMQSYLKQYLSQKGFFNSTNIALVDIGWRGTIQDCLAYAFNDYKSYPEIHGYYLALNPPVLPTSSVRSGLIYDYRNTYPEEIFISLFREALELSCRALHGTTIDYTQSRTGRVIPVFNKAPSDRVSEAKINANILQIQRGILDFTTDYLKLSKIIDTNPQELKHALVKSYDQLVSQPLKEHIEAMNQIINTDDFGTDRVRPIIRHFDYNELFNPKDFILNLIEVPWREASLKSSGLSVMNFFYYFAKRIVCSYRIIKNANT